MKTPTEVLKSMRAPMAAKGVAFAGHATGAEIFPDGAAVVVVAPSVRLLEHALRALGSIGPFDKAAVKKVAVFQFADTMPAEFSAPRRKALGRVK